MNLNVVKFPVGYLIYYKSWMGVEDTVGIDVEFSLSLYISCISPLNRKPYRLCHTPVTQVIFQRKVFYPCNAFLCLILDFLNAGVTIRGVCVEQLGHVKYY